MLAVVGRALRPRAMPVHYGWSFRHQHGFAMVMARSPYYCPLRRRPAKAWSEPSANGNTEAQREPRCTRGYDTLPGIVRILLGGPAQRGVNWQFGLKQQ